MNKILQDFFGLKWNPFCPTLPSEARSSHRAVEHFGLPPRRQGAARRLRPHHRRPGTGKSVSCRILAERLSRSARRHRRCGQPSAERRDPISTRAGRSLRRAAGARKPLGSFKCLRDKWQAHIEATLMRPVLLVDEATEMSGQVLASCASVQRALRLALPTSPPSSAATPA